MLPFFIYTQPDTARSLLRYRHHTLPGARELAAESGLRGARYPVGVGGHRAGGVPDVHHRRARTASGPGTRRSTSRPTSRTASLTYVAATGDVDS